eukprot:m.294797 g.294797  ORF g.294797 m.294797 type:complete len:143 (-) comp16389_c0_seq116:4275-4703(-)
MIRLLCSEMEQMEEIGVIFIGYGKKRTLVKAEMPAMCGDSDIRIVHATLNMWFHYAHAASWMRHTEKQIDRNLSVNALMVDWECDVVNSFRYAKNMPLHWLPKQEYGLKDTARWNVTSLVREWCEGTRRNYGTFLDGHSSYQ